MTVETLQKKTRAAFEEKFTEDENHPYTKDDYIKFNDEADLNEILTFLDTIVADAYKEGFESGKKEKKSEVAKKLREWYISVSDIQKVPDMNKRVMNLISNL